MTSSSRQLRVRCTRCRRAGFTLIELILVMTILTFVVMMIRPMLSGFTAGRNANNAATRIVSLAKQARMQSISEGRRYRMNVDASSGALWLAAEDGGTFTALADKSDPIEGVKIETDLTSQQDGTYVEFRPSGRCDAARFWVTDRLGNTLEVACLSPTELFLILPPQEMTK